MANDIEITKFYEMLCDAANIKIDERGRLYLETGTKDKQKNYCKLTLADKEKDIVLPTYNNLRDRDIDRDVFFHPLGESIQNGKSEVSDFLHRTMLVRLNVSLAVLGVGLLTVQDNPDVHGRLDKNQIEIMKGISESDSKSVGNWSMMTSMAFTRFADNMSKWNVNISVKRKGTYKGKEYKRVGVVSFPAIEFVEDGGRYFKGDGKDAKDMFRKVDYKTFTQVTRAIFPGATELEKYNAVCNGTIAPYLIAFLSAFSNVAERINQVIKVMEPIFSAISFDASAAAIPCEWTEYLKEDKSDTLSHWLRRLPSLEGNQGRLSDIAEIREREHEEELKRKTVAKKEVPPWEDEEPEKVEREKPVERHVPTADNPYGITRPIGRRRTEAPSGSGIVKETRPVTDQAAEIERRRMDLELQEREARIKRLAEEERITRERLRLEREREEREFEEDRRRREARRREERDYRGGRERDDDRDDRRDDRPRDRDRDREPDRDRESVKTEDGKLDFAAMLRSRPEIAEGTPTYERERDYERSGRRRSRYFDSDDRDDRDYRDRDRRGYGRDSRDDGWGSRRRRY